MTPPKILIVDDESAARQMLEALLFRDGYNLAFAANGAEALAQLEEFEPDAILLDVMMPHMNGFEVCRRLKADTRWQHVPVILLTALDSKAALVSGFDAGADDFLGKPVNSLELRARLRSMLRIKAQYDALEKQRRELDASLCLSEKYARVLAQRLEALKSLHTVGLRLMSNLDTDSMPALISQAALNLVPGATRCVMHFLSGHDHELLPVVFFPEAYAKTIPPTIGIEEIVRQAIQIGQAIYVPDVLADPRCPRSPLHDMRALLVTPLVDDQQPIAALSVYSPEVDAFEESHHHTLSILATQAAVAIVKARFFQEREALRQREKRVIQDLFQHYVSPIVVNRLIDGLEDVGLGGERHEISVLFADIHAFTTFSEKQAPERLIEVLNRYLTLAAEAILAQEGTLDKFMGDGVMAFFNAPLPQPDHTLRAVQAALAIQQTIAQHNSAVSGPDRLFFDMGIHVGPAVVGNIGTPQQMNYTAIGDTVNLAKRLQENARGGQIILGQAAYEAVKEVVMVEDLGPLVVKGHTAAEHAYALIGLIH